MFFGNKNKAAMFGLEGESLRKQFGELFLARLQRLTFRLVEGHQATWPLNSKGAMFGLDARIALAIFGALSVIVGAALYNTVQDAKVVGLLNDMTELEKALDAYIIDTGEDTTPSLNSVGGGIGYLINDPGKVGWKGPYLSYEYGTSDHAIHPIYAKIYLRIVTDENWSHPAENSDAYLCNNNVSKTCYYWAMINGVSDHLKKLLDLKIDGTESMNSGKVRYSDGNTELYLRLHRTLNQN